MSTFRMIARPKSSIVTMDFEYYCQAMDFVIKSAALSPSKPYKRSNGQWAVSLVGAIEKAKFIKLPHWEQPNHLYNEWRGLEPLYHLPLPPVLPKIEVVQDEEEYA